MAVERFTATTTAVVAVTGYSSLRSLTDRVRLQVRRGTPVVIVDLTRADGLTRAALARLVVLNRLADRHGTELRLLCGAHGAAVAGHVLAGCGPSIDVALAEAVAA